MTYPDRVERCILVVNDLTLFIFTWHAPIIVYRYDFGQHPQCPNRSLAFFAVKQIVDPVPDLHFPASFFANSSPRRLIIEGLLTPFTPSKSRMQLLDSHSPKQRGYCETKN
eukprot:TRINITY_DN11709_c1_g1_i1.p5 TRINITY_DN11709_c1_g1~~TRINITY_DN11709_c1_g1_i1.p5  ORF type:complete len:111 (+),score=1.62 TRINITY_DN11709_c1_g1_i1:3204-3536(+)